MFKIVDECDRLWLWWLLNWLSSYVYTSFLNDIYISICFLGCVAFKPPPSKLTDFSWLFWNVAHVGSSILRCILYWIADCMWIPRCCVGQITHGCFELLSQAHKGHKLLWWEFCRLSQCSLSLNLFFSLCWPVMLISTAAVVYSIENYVYSGLCVHCSVILITTLF